MSDYLVSQSETSRKLGVSLYHVRKAIEAGTLETRNLNGRTFIIRKSLEDFIGGGTEGGLADRDARRRELAAEFAPWPFTDWKYSAVDSVGQKAIDRIIDMERREQDEQ